MDIGGFRDMHRHRRCVQLLQGYTDAHGYEEPVCPGQPTLAEAGLEASYNAAMDAAFAAYRQLRDSGAPEAAQSAQYCLPLGTRCRSMFKMDFAEVALHLRAALRRGWPLQLPPRRLGDVQSGREEASSAGRIISGSRTSTSRWIC